MTNLRDAPGGEMRLETRDAIRPDDSVMRGPGRQIEPVTGGEHDGPPLKSEGDRAARTDDHLVEGVPMRVVGVARIVRPRGRLQALVAQMAGEAGAHIAKIDR